jgi:hypothetical protein
MKENKLDQPLKFLHFNDPRVNKLTPKSIFSKWQNRTVAVIPLTAGEIRQVAFDFLNRAPDTQLFVRLAVGVTFVSRDDNYNKAIGRDQATQRLEEVNLEVTALNVNSTHIHITLASHKGVSLNLRTNLKTKFSTVTGTLTGQEVDW